MIEKVKLTEEYQISPILNGLWQLSEGHNLKGRLDENDILYAFNELVEAGFTTFDLADIYIGAEDILGQFLKNLKSHSTLSKHDVQIHEKYVPDLDVLETVSFKDTEYIIDRSLKKLGRDYIDLIQFHWWDYDIKRYIDVAENLVKLQEKGKIRYIGVTNFDTKHLKELVDANIPIISCQTQYSLFDRRPEKELINYSMKTGIEQICYGTLAGGLLSERYIGEKEIEPNSRSQVKYFQIIEETLGMNGYQDLLNILSKIAKKYDVSIANVATRYILEQKGVAGTIIGIRNSKHIHSNRKVFSFTLTDEDKAMIDQFIKQFPMIPGDTYEEERNPESRFRKIIRMNEAES